MKQALIFLSSAIALMFFFGASQAQNNQAPLNANEKKQVVYSVGKQLTDFYIFPPVAKKMTEFISKNLEDGVYTPIDDPNNFASRLTEDLVSVSNDKHLKVQFDPEWVTENKKPTTADDNPELISREMPKWRRGNFGFKEVKILEGNVGYLNLTSFRETEFAGETAIAAMNFFRNADALIIDLRNNGGGDSSMVQLVASYLFDSKPVLLGDSYFREGEKENHTQDWTLPYVPGKRRPDIDVYILTSRRTFSAAEGFGFGLKNLKRAVIIGEKTGGGAHFITRKAATDRFSIWVSNGRSIDPVTKTDWEGVGVIPDIDASAGDALITAQVKALEKLVEKYPANKDMYQWHLTSIKAKQNPVQIDHLTLASYAGTYGPRILTVENGKLFSQRKGGPKYELTPLARDLFTIEWMPDFRLKMLIENGKATGAVTMIENGPTVTDIKEKN